MIDIPAGMTEKTIRMFLKPGAVFYFTDSAAGPDPHFYFVLNANPDTDSEIILVNATSNVEGARRRTSRFPGCLVELTPADYPEFTRSVSALDCTEVHTRTLSQLAGKLALGELRFRSQASDDVLGKLRSAVLNSPLVERKYKKLLDESAEREQATQPGDATVSIEPRS